MNVIHVTDKEELLRDIADTYGKGVATLVDEEGLFVIFSMVDESGNEIRLGSKKS